MIQSYFYHDAEGRIVEAGQCSKAVKLPKKPGLTLKEGVASIEDFFDGQEIRRLPAKPSSVHKFNYKTKTWEVDIEDAWQQVREERNKKLSACDWTQLSDSPGNKRGGWAMYRQALRDITNQEDPLNIVWPIAP